MVKTTLIPLAALLWLTTSCAPRVDPVVGEGCEINTDCAFPLGCGYGTCRRVCIESRDCGAGLRCLIDRGETSGVCQLPEESRCTLNSECPRGFECVHATCTLNCSVDADCTVPGSVCVEEIVDGVGTGLLGCQEPLDELCIYDSDCPAEPFPFVCAFDGTCQIECNEPRDCVNPRMCVENLCVLPPT